MRKFELSPNEYDKAEEFKKNQFIKDSRLPAAGERWSYIITPTGLGTIVKIKDEFLGDIEDVTEWETW